MNLRWVWVGHLRGLRQRWRRTLLSVVAVGAGVSLALGVVIANHSVTESLNSFSANLSFGAALRVEAPADHGSLDDTVVARVAETPGVKAAVPLVITIAQAVDSRGRELLVPAFGVDCSIEAVVGAFSCDAESMASAGDVPILGSALRDRLGSRGALRTNLTEFSTSQLFALPELNRLNRGLVALFPLAASQRQFTRPSGLDAILVMAEKDTDVETLRTTLEGVVGKQNKVVDASAPLSSSEVANLMLPLLFLISLIGLVIGAQLVRNTVELSLEERRRELATTGALGATPRQILLGLLTEAGVIGLLGGVLALAGASLIARTFVESLSEQIQTATGLSVSAFTPAYAVALGLGLALGVSVIASLAPARRASRIDLVAELSGRASFDRDRAASRRGLAVTAALVALTTALAWLGQRDGALEPWQPPLSIAGLFGSTIACYTACVQLAPRLLSLLQRVPLFSTGPARVALSNLLGARRRTIAVTIAIAAPVFFSTVVGGVVPGLSAAARDFANQSNADRVFVSTLATNNTSNIDAKVTPEMRRQLAAVPGVAAIEQEYFVSVTPRGGGLFAIDATDGVAPEHHVYRGVGGAEAFRQGKVMVGPALARQRNLEPGDTVSVPSRFGEAATFVVGGVWASPESMGYSVAMSGDQLRSIFGERPPGNLRLVPAPGIDAETLAANIKAANISPRLRVLTAGELADELAAEFAKFAAPFDALRIALVAVALVATASTLVLAAAQRRRDNATLAALGMAPGDLALSTVIETVLTAAAVTVVAVVCAQFTLVNFTWASALITGLGIPYRLAPGPVVSAAVVTAAIALVGSVLPAWRTARTNVMEALRAA